MYGYTIVNDITARDLQMQHQQRALGKSFDTPYPMGPAGVGVVLKPTAYLQQGDAINVAIEGTGFIENKFIGRSIFSWRAA